MCFDKACRESRLGQCALRVSDKERFSRLRLSGMYAAVSSWEGSGNCFYVGDVRIELCINIVVILEPANLEKHNT